MQREAEGENKDKIGIMEVEERGDPMAPNFNNVLTMSPSSIKWFQPSWRLHGKGQCY